MYLAELQQVKIELLFQKLQQLIPNAISDNTVEDTSIGALLGNILWQSNQHYIGACIGDILGTQVQDWSDDLIKSKFGELVTVFPKPEKGKPPYGRY